MHAYHPRYFSVCKSGQKMVQSPTPIRMCFRLLQLCKFSCGFELSYFYAFQARVSEQSFKLLARGQGPPRLECVYGSYKCHTTASFGNDIFNLVYACVSFNILCGLQKRPEDCAFTNSHEQVFSIACSRWSAIFLHAAVGSFVKVCVLAMRHTCNTTATASTGNQKT